MVAREGIQWMASDEEVLARSLGKTAFARNAQEVVQDADALYRPYVVSSRDNQMYIVFRDKVISDKVGFTYSGTPGKAAAQDFVDRILAIRDQLAEAGADGPHLVSVILDGENAWEHYANDGKEFLQHLYHLLEEEQEKGTIQTITPSAYVAQFPEQPADRGPVGRQLGQPRLPDLDRRGRGEPGLGLPGAGAGYRRKERSWPWTTRPWRRSWTPSTPPRAATGSGGTAPTRTAATTAALTCSSGGRLQRVYEHDRRTGAHLPQGAGHPPAGPSAGGRRLGPHHARRSTAWATRASGRAPATIWRRAACRPRPTRSSASCGTALTKSTPLPAPGRPPALGGCGRRDARRLLPDPARRRHRAALSAASLATGSEETLLGFGANALVEVAITAAIGATCHPLCRGRGRRLR